MKDWIRTKLGAERLAKLEEFYAGQSRMQIIFAIMLLMTLPFFYGLIQQFCELYWYRVEQNPEYDWPSFWDLKTACSSCFLLFTCKSYMVKLLTPLTMRIISDKYTGQQRQELAEKSAYSFFKSAYFVCAVVFGYMVQKDAPWLPPIMGGSGDVAVVFQGYPYFSYEQFPLLRPYLMIQLGYHMFSLINTIMDPKRKDYLEMLLHHVATVTLITFAYLMNYTPISGLILLNIDKCDVFIYAIKAWVDSKYTWVVLVYFFLTLVHLIFDRLYVFPMYLIWHAVWFNNDYYQEVPGFWLMAAFLHLLLVLHAYWCILLVKMGIRFARTGKKNDMHHDKGDLKKPVVEASEQDKHETNKAKAD